MAKTLMGRRPCSRPGCVAFAAPNEDECLPHLLEPKRHKFNAKATIVDGIRFDSQWESTRYAELKLLERAGLIRDLRLQHDFPLTVNGVTIGLLRLDFSYIDERPDAARPGALVVEDAKGMKTRMYRLKKKHFEAQYGIPIVEVMAPSKRRR